MPKIATDRYVDRAELDDFIRSRGGFPARLFPDEAGLSAAVPAADPCPHDRD